MNEPENDNKLKKVEEAVEYVLKVKERFANAPFIYAEFLKTMAEYRHHTISTEEVMHRILSIFTAHLDLLIDFNRFLPPGSQFTKMIPSVYNRPGHHAQPVVQSAAQANAVEYIRKVRERFVADRPEVYASFLDTINGFHSKDDFLSTNNYVALADKVWALFGEENKDLIEEFKVFSP
jgi:histone deacetylase complex regulatory component SIN3